MVKPELLAPAGTLNNLRYALAYGADAVYAGMPRYSLRVRNNDFSTLEQLQRGIDETHSQGKQLFLATNVLPHDAKVKTFIDDMAPIIDLKPDALIMADPGLIALVRQRWPEQVIHLSVQANTMNSAAVRFWHSLGVQRVILSRELSLNEVAEIRQQCPDTELELFVHGALCIAYSGRCLLSGYFNHRDANQGSCTNACRWQYRLEAGGQESMLGTERHPEADGSYLLEEVTRAGEMMPIEEDEQGTYIMNSRDLRAVEHVQRLVEIGVDSLKIEGRTKSHYYVARTAQVYRRAIDDAVAGRPFNPALVTELDFLANRGYTDGFYQRHHSHEHQNYLTNHSTETRQQFVGEISEFNPESGIATIVVKNRFEVGDTLQLITPNGHSRFQLEQMQKLGGEAVGVAPGSGHQVQMALPLDSGSWHYALLAKELASWGDEAL
ncbi:U32 family peptidase [Ectothiorhodospiraceae bacterium BW-2]|nr:U32 family peptidase [Ectothiorhodospiraceae bacterium BW-2]